MSPAAARDPHWPARAPRRPALRRVEQAVGIVLSVVVLVVLVLIGAASAVVEIARRAEGRL